MTEIFRRFGPAYLKKFGDKILAQHKKAIKDISLCRTDVMGGQVYYCQRCEKYHYSYHSCKNRHCPKCQNDKADQWLEKQKKLLLPVNYFLLTFTLHNNLRKLARSNQKLFYNIMFRASWLAMQKLAYDKKYVGGILGVIGVLQTWSKDLMYHPHVHYVVPGGGLSQDRKKWFSAKKEFFLPVIALSIIFRAKFRDALKKENPNLFNQIPKNTWTDDWVVNCIPSGIGESALKYLAPYIFRVAISNKRIKKIDNDKVTFEYTSSETKIIKQLTISPDEFIRRFLQHVLPKGFVKVRYYGIFAFNNKNIFKKVREILKVKEQNTKHETIAKIPTCPECGRELILVKEVHKGEKWPNAPPDKIPLSLIYNQLFNRL